MERSRSIAVDVARGLAVVLMIQTHAYDGWVRDDLRATAAYRFTRFLGVLPLPTFLVLAGVGMVLRLDAGSRRGEAPDSVRPALVRRGLEVLAAGYALNVGLGLLDGGASVATFLRVDVLHAIGLAIALAAWLGIRAPEVTRRVVGVGVALFFVAALLVIPGTRVGRSLHGPARYLAGLIVEVPGVTKMPLVPLAGLLGVGLVLGVALRPGAGLTDRSRALALALAAAGIAAGCVVAEDALVARIPGAFDRTHPAVVVNLVELAARAIASVALVLAIDPPTTSRVARWLALLGRHSLLGYAVHLPFAYGRIPKTISRALDVPTATGWLVLLVVGTTAVVALVDRRERRARA